MKTVFTLVSAMGVLTLAGCTGNSRHEVALCAEPIKITACEAGQFYPTCTIENEARATLQGNQYTWSYDRSGVQLGSPLPLQVAGLMPGQKRRVELLAAGGSKNISKIVVCSMDPTGPLMKGRVVSVGIAR